MQAHALRPHPAARTAVPYDGVTLACTRAQEAVRAPALPLPLADAPQILYADVAGPAEAALDALAAARPVHLVFGAVPNLM